MKRSKKIKTVQHERLISHAMFELNLMLAQSACPDVCPLLSANITAYCQSALEQQQLIDLDAVNQVEISVQMLDDKAMQSLNSQYRQKNSATNVLSFESGLPVLQQPDSSALLVLGDIVLCPEVINTEALDQGKSAQQHWAHMLVHGTLHLCGYDHVDPEEAAQMEALEIQILLNAGMSNPYDIQCVQ